MSEKESNRELPICQHSDNTSTGKKRRFICPVCGCPTLRYITTNVTLSSRVIFPNGKIEYDEEDILYTEDTNYYYECGGCETALGVGWELNDHTRRGKLIKWFEDGNNGTEEQLSRYLAKRALIKSECRQRNER